MDEIEHLVGQSDVEEEFTLLLGDGRDLISADGVAIQDQRSARVFVFGSKSRRLVALDSRQGVDARNGQSNTEEALSEN